MIQNIIQFIVNFIEAFFIISFMFLFLKIEIENNKKVALEYFIFGIMSFIEQKLFLDSSYKTIVGMLIYIILFKIFHNHISFRKIIISNIFTFVIILVIQMLLTIPYILLFGGSLETISSNGFIFILFMIVSFVMEYLIITIIYHRRNVK